LLCSARQIIYAPLLVSGINRKKSDLT